MPLWVEVTPGVVRCGFWRWGLVEHRDPIVQRVRFRLLVVGRTALVLTGGGRKTAYIIDFPGQRSRLESALEEAGFQISDRVAERWFPPL
jgi:hypothetical protein